MVAKFLDDNKPKTSLKKWIHTVSKFIDLIQFHLIFQKCWRNFLGLNPKGLYLSLEKEKENFVLCSSTPSMQACPRNQKFHVAVVQRWLTNVQKSVMHVQNYCFNNLNRLLFRHSRCRRHRRCLSSLLVRSRSFVTMGMWRHTSPLYRLKSPYSRDGEIQ